MGFVVQVEDLLYIWTLLPFYNIYILYIYTIYIYINDLSFLDDGIFWYILLLSMDITLCVFSYTIEGELIIDIGGF